MATRAVIVMAAAAAAVATAGCILLVNETTLDGDQFTSNCALLPEGGADASPCGACVSSSCAAALTACCADSDCRTVLPALDTCAGGGTCDPTTLPADVGSCIVASCGSVCDVPAGIDCTAGASGLACGCKFDKTPNSTPCKATAFTNGICCADNAWPSDAATRGCGCFTYGCTAGSTADCDCTIGGTATMVGGCSIDTPTIQQCCASTTSFDCYCTTTSSTCNTGYNQTTSCDTDLFCNNFNSSPTGDCRINP